MRLCIHTAASSAWMAATRSSYCDGSKSTLQGARAGAGISVRQLRFWQYSKQARPPWQVTRLLWTVPPCGDPPPLPGPGCRQVACAHLLYIYMATNPSNQATS